MAKEQKIEDILTGLTIKFSIGSKFNILTIYGNFEVKNRDFYFDKRGKFAGTGIGVGVGVCQSEGS